MKKQLLAALFGFLIFFFFKGGKQLPVIGGFIGFMEFLLIVSVLGYLLYAFIRYIYLWYKAK